MLQSPRVSVLIVELQDPSFPAWSSLLFTCFPHICSCFHIQELSRHSLTLAVAQVFAVTLRPECKSAKSTSCTHTLAHIGPYILGERNIRTKLSSKRQGGASQKTAAIYDKGRVEGLPTLFLFATRTKERPSSISRKCAVAQRQLRRRLLRKSVRKGKQVLPS